MSGAPRILYFSQHWPHRATYGSELRSFQIRRALQEIGKVDVVVLDVEGGGEDWLENTDDGFKIGDVIAVQEHNNKGIYQKLRWAFDPYSCYPHGRSVDAEASQRVLHRLEKYDLIWFSKIRTSGMFSQWRWPRSVLDIDDVPSTFETSVLRNGGGTFHERLLTRLRRSSWRRRETLLGDRFTVLSVCSNEDKRYLQSMGLSVPIHVIPNGFEPASEEPIRTPASPPRIGFIGTLDYYPNLEGVEWFLNLCWPRIKQKCPAMQLRLVGRHSRGPLKSSHPDVEELGWIANVDDEIATWSAMIIPLQKGAGTRGKIAFGFSRNCPIVSTSLGAYGYEVRHEEEILLGDTPDTFAEACLRVIDCPDEAGRMAQKARQKFLQRWTWDAIKPRIWAAAEDCLGRSDGNSKVGSNVTLAKK
jgi:glycosyltransferase involved in cell wall biosynthesis